MADPKILYQSLILDHNRAPHHFGKILQSTHQKRGLNPSCGDNLELYARIEGDRLLDIGFLGEGCAIFKASCSLLCDGVVGKSLTEAKDLLLLFEEMILNPDPLAPEKEVALGKLALFAGVKQYPARVKCALLGARTLEALIQQKDHTDASSADISTE